MSKARQLGTQFESSLIPLLREYYPEAVRAPLAGTKDVGDFLNIDRRFILQAKNCKEMRLPEWLKAARQQAQNARKSVGVVVHKRRGVAAPENQYVTMELRDFLDLVWGVYGDVYS